MALKTLGEVLGATTDLLTVRVRDAKLHRGRLSVSITRDDEVLTTSRERRQHFQSADSEWLQYQVELSKNQEAAIADSDHPVEFITGGVCPILKLEDGEFVVSVLRDIYPTGFLIPGGCPASIVELLDPRIAAEREVTEELFLGDKQGTAFSIGTQDLLKRGLRDWGIAIKKIIPAPQIDTHVALMSGDAQSLEINTSIAGNARLDNTTLFLDHEVASLQLVLYWRIHLPLRVPDLRMWDGERLPDGTLLRRLMRLTALGGHTEAFFMNGNFVPPHGGWLSDTMERQAVLKSG